MSNVPQPISGGVRYSLASLLLMTAVVALILGGLSAGLAAWEEKERTALVVGGALGAGVGNLLGFTLGMQSRRRFWNALIGWLVGIPTGAAAGVLAVLPGALQVLLPGSLVLVLFAAVVRRLSRGRT